jgi:hypothetical protein
VKICKKVGSGNRILDHSIADNDIISKVYWWKSLNLFTIPVSFEITENKELTPDLIEDKKIFPNDSEKNGSMDTTWLWKLLKFKMEKK